MQNQRLSRSEQRLQTRNRLLDSAATLFAEKGVNGASVEQIAENAGFSRGAFYGNFANKHELVIELLEQRTARELNEVSEIATGPAPFEALREWHRGRAGNLDGWLSLRTELLLYAIRNPEFRPRLAERERVALDAHTSSIEHAFAERGTEPPAPAAFLALIVHALEDGLLFQRMLHPDDVTDDIVVDAAEFLMTNWLNTPSDSQ
ncbi:TetR/AcrR family transcriptional regulator [Brevibacterium aurantiacum]|uniref:TetR/AcrR family transcriptional regulator n=1 Tax=Brevibacterium aurantiacum TaxID=273384 RepID=A0A4Z0KKR7_BREAU|nr:TetR/AcrR family transcriptional regulator [Brevibacterium aurantiacum]TGD38805.1 TetR/AcrR family transcriptional regulator [Brevibacterium aurantiacum]